MDQYDQWHPYPSSVCAQMTNRPYRYIAGNGSRYDLDPVGLTQINVSSGVTRSIRKTQPVDMSACWECTGCGYLTPDLSADMCAACQCARAPPPVQDTPVAADSPKRRRSGGGSKAAKKIKAHGIQYLMKMLRSLLKQTRDRVFDRRRLLKVLSFLYRNVTPPPVSVATVQSFESCQVCFCEFNGSNTQPVPLPVECGGGGVICNICMTQYLDSRVADGDVMPWIPTPAEGNAYPLPVSTISGYCDDILLCLMGICMLTKVLAREPCWVQCTACDFGFEATVQPLEQKCGHCFHVQIVSSDPLETDQDLQALVRSGAMRLCPVCRDPTMKDFGICNVLECGKCKMWWHWETREHGQSGPELKAKARTAGTLWQPGELAYQQQLEQTDPAAFKSLLERNGIKHDPNYRRGL